MVCNGLPWCATVYRGVQQFTVVCNGLPWCATVYRGVQPCTVVCNSVLWCTVILHVVNLLSAVFSMAWSTEEECGGLQVEVDTSVIVSYTVVSSGSCASMCMCTKAKEKEKDELYC